MSAVNSLIGFTTFWTVGVFSPVRFGWQGIGLVWRFPPWFPAAASGDSDRGRSVPFSGAAIAGRVPVFDSRMRKSVPTDPFHEAVLRNSSGVLQSRERWGPARSDSSAKASTRRLILARSSGMSQRPWNSQCQVPTARSTFPSGLGDHGGRTRRAMPRLWHSRSNSALNSDPPSTWMTSALNGALRTSLSRKSAALRAVALL